MKTPFVSECGHRKSIPQKQYEELNEYLERLKSYAYHIETCGEGKNSYSKTEHDVTFMCLKRDSKIENSYKETPTPTNVGFGVS